MPLMEISIKTCPICEKEFKPRRSWQKFCSSTCSNASHANHYVGATSGMGLPNGTTGAISELRVAADLLTKGYEVFRAVSAHCSCDLAILRDGKLIRVEVRTGYIHNTNGKRITNRPKSTSKFDVLAICYNDNIEYEPSLV